MKIADNFSQILNNIEMAKQKSIYKNEVEIVGVTKFIEIDDMKKAIELGIKNFGENRPQELKRKFEILGDVVLWHQIGTLQKNKIKYIIDKVDLIHSLDSLSLAEEINKFAIKIDKTQKCLLQIKVSEEDSKKGLDEESIIETYKNIKNNCSNIEICGIMGMAPFFEEAEKSREYFKRLKNIFEELKIFSNNKFDILSMGMSNDYIVAIEEGATMVRIGSALFS